MFLLVIEQPHVSVDPTLLLLRTWSAWTLAAPSNSNNEFIHVFTFWKVFKLLTLSLTRNVAVSKWVGSLRQ